MYISRPNLIAILAVLLEQGKKCAKFLVFTSLINYFIPFFSKEIRFRAVWERRGLGSPKVPFWVIYLLRHCY